MTTTYRVTDDEAAAGACGWEYDTARDAIEKFAFVSGLKAEWEGVFGIEAARNLLDDIEIDLRTREVGIGAFSAGGYTVARVG